MKRNITGLAIILSGSVAIAQETPVPNSNVSADYSINIVSSHI